MSSLYRELKEQWEKIHNYLGIILDYKMPAVVRVSMVDYINGIIYEFLEVIGGEVASPAANHLFLVQSDDKALKLPARNRQYISNILWPSYYL